MNTSSPFGASPPLTPNTPASSVRAATGVIAAAMASGSATAREIAQAEADAGILFDPQRAEDIASAAAEQAHAEALAAIAE
uniref:hypothetical protein n=1 Tax=Streptomyces acidiscabies TaxID=42234 RepID=UPI00117CA8F5